MNTLTHENFIKIITEIMSLQGGFNSSKLAIKQMNEFWWQLSNSDVINSKGAWASEYLGHALDSDGVEILAVLMIDENDFPCDFEIIKIDGEKILTNINELKFDYLSGK